MHFGTAALLIISATLTLCPAQGWETLSAGVARVDITPPLEMGASLGGYGDRMSKPATGVHDRVMAKALVLSSSGDRFAFVTLDALAIPPAFRKSLLEKLASDDWRPDQILLLPSHSHTSIDMNAINSKNRFPIPNLGLYQQELHDFLLAKMVEVIHTASLDPVPAVVGTSAKSLQGNWTRNRREGNSFTRPVLTLTRIDTREGKPLAALVNWTAHPTFTSANDMMFSGEWPGHLQRTLEALIGQSATVLYYNGAEGDQSPVARPDSGNSSWEKTERYGRELAIEAHQVWQSISPQPIAHLSYHLETISLPKRTWHPDFMSTGGTEYGLREEIMEGVLGELAPETSSTLSFRLDDLLIVGIPGELAAQLGNDLANNLRVSTGAEHVTIGGLANEWISYILSPEEYTKGGYESSVSFYGPTLAPVVLEAAVRGAENLGSPTAQ